MWRVEGRETEGEVLARAQDEEEAGGGCGGQPDATQGSLVGAGISECPARAPRFSAASPSSSPEAEGGALRSGAEAVRPRPPPSLLRQPEDSYPNMELGFPRPRPRPRPAGRHRLAIRRGCVGGNRSLWGLATGASGGEGYLGADLDPHHALVLCLSFPRQWLRLIS